MAERIKLNTLKPAKGSRFTARRVGRGNGSGHGTTCGRGYKGQKSRSGGYHKVNFEGGQMPINRRLPKIGFRSRKKALTAEVKLSEIAKLNMDTVDMDVLKKAGIVPLATRKVKLILSGTLEKPVTLRQCSATAGARKAIEAAGGKVE